MRTLPRAASLLKDRVQLEPVLWYETRDAELRAKLLHAEKLRRCAVLREAEYDPGFRGALYTRSRVEIEFWFNNFVFTFDPRDCQNYPFTLWPVQRRYLRFIQDALDRQTDWLCEKSRDMGCTYLNMGFAVHKWLFVPGFNSGFCANKSDLVDQLGNPSTIMEKGRMIIEGLPWWMKPYGYNRFEHSMYKRFVNPDNNNVMIGEGGNEAGRGGRFSIYFIDEAAHLDNADAINYATSATSRCRGWVSSANGMGNYFYTKKEARDCPIETIHWREHPWKDDEWAKAEKKRIGRVAFAQEHDIDFAASLSGMVVEKLWVDAAVELWRMLEHPSHTDCCAGLDVGAGKDLSIFQPRRGCLVPKAEQRSEPDTTETALWALDLCRRHGVRRLIYDSVGVGEGVKSTLKRGWHEVPNFRMFACNWGLPPVSSRRWEDGKTSKEKFRDIKAECWWTMREAFRRSYELWLFLTGSEDGIEHDPSDCVLLEPNIELQRQLVTVRWDVTIAGNKIKIEDKASLKRRGIKSPDWADALAYSYHVTPQIIVSEHFIIAETRPTLDLGH